MIWFLWESIPNASCAMAQKLTDPRIFRKTFWNSDYGLRCLMRPNPSSEKSTKVKKRVSLKQQRGLLACQNSTILQPEIWNWTRLEQMSLQKGFWLKDQKVVANPQTFGWLAENLSKIWGKLTKCHKMWARFSSSGLKKFTILIWARAKFWKVEGWEVVAGPAAGPTDL